MDLRAQIRRIRISRTVAVVAVALASILASACGGPREPGDLRGWSVLLLTLDTTRADHIGCYGSVRAETGTIDGLAASGVRFENAFTPSPLTLPSHASILTGTDPRYHGARDNALYLLDDENRTLAEILAEAGYRTGAVIAASVVSSRYGMAQGFERFDENLTEQETRFSDYSRRAGEVTDRTLDLVREFRREKFFVWAHYFDPHARYDPPEPYRSRFRDSLYDGEIAYMDAMIGRLLAGLARIGAAERTLVVVVADHGEGLLHPHRESAHGVFLYDETVRVPMILHAPGGLPEGAVLTSVVRTVDLVPTILDLLGIAPPPEVQGRSLVPLALGSEPAGTPSPPALAETLFPWNTYGWSPLRSVRTERFKYIDAPEPELYDLASDPTEQINLFGASATSDETMRALLEERTREVLHPRRTESRLITEPSVREALADLGYLEGGEPAEDEPPPTKDPKEFIEVTNWMIEARTLLLEGKKAEARARVERALDLDPGNPTVLYFRAELLLEDGKNGEAVDTLEKLIAIRPRFAEAHFLLGRARAAEAERLRAEGREREADEAVDQAIASLERAASQNPYHVEALAELGFLLIARGRDEAALVVYRSADALVPDNPDILRNIAYLENRLGEREALVVTLRRLHAVRPTPETAATLGSVLFEEGRAREALPLLEEALRGDPENRRYRDALEACRARLGR